MSKYLSEMEMLKILYKLDEESNSIQSPENYPRDSRTAAADNIRKDGRVRVEQGKVIVDNPINGGNYPTIRAKWPVKLWVDGQEIEYGTEVSSESEIEWKIQDKPLYEVAISEDKLEASLQIHRLQRYVWILTEQDSALHIMITAKEDRELVLETINLQDVLTTVEDMNIRMNLDVGAVQSEVARPSYQWVTIASGKIPIEGQDAKLELYFSENIDDNFTELGGVVDFKNRLNIPSVKEGDVIARKIPAIEGYAGYDVFGNILLPEPVKDIRIVGKENVEITSDYQVIARKSGRPRVTGNKIKYFDINTAFVVAGDVNLSTGNIVFSGDVVVYGDVMDNMIIESLGNIYVTGSVFNSTLTATGSIAVKGNVLGSKLYSGYFGMLYNRIYHSSKQLIDIGEQMMNSAKQLMNETRKKKIQVRYGQIIVLIMESKFRQAGDFIKELLGAISSLQSFNKEDLMQLRIYLDILQNKVKLVEVMNEPRMEDFMRILKEAYRRVALSQESNVQININQAHQSYLKSNGDILVRKEGVIQCDLYSAGNIIFFLDRAVCRGCRLEAGDTISAMYVGGITGAKTSLKAAKKIVIKKMYEGRIIIDRYSMEIMEPIEDRVFDTNGMKQLV